MANPYSVILELYIWEKSPPTPTEDPAFHTLAGYAHPPEIGSVIFLNSVEYEVKAVETHIQDRVFSNPTSGSDEWSLEPILYKVWVEEQ